MIMGTAITIDIVDEDSTLDTAALADAAFAWFDEVDHRFSTYKADSEVSRLARGELNRDTVSDDTRHVLDACEDLREATRGYFDAYATGRLDPSGYVKGWSVRVASDRLRNAGAVNHCVNAGGDIRVLGVAPGGLPWRVGVVHPWRRDMVAWVLTGTDLAIATSGTYERGAHVVDPFTGTPVTYLRSVTVTGPDIALADAYATAAMAMGRRGIDWLAQIDGYECAIITDTGEAYRSERLPAVT
jgi:thiamine biosynthesis lipoprotein